MLSIGAAMLGALHVVGVDVDDDALRIAQQNVDEYEDPLPVRTRIYIAAGGHEDLLPVGPAGGRWPRGTASYILVCTCADTIRDRALAVRGGRLLCA